MLEDLWLAIRARHPEIPAVVIIIASGTEGKQARWGHYAPGSWVTGNQARPEIMISGEGLRRDARSVLGTLLHEAAHALAAARGIKDTSRQGRYHNKQFKAHGEELGITVEFDKRIGWSPTTVPGPTAARYERELQALAEAMTLWRLDESLTTTTAATAQHQPDRRHLPLRPPHPGGRLHPRRGTHHLRRLRRPIPAPTLKGPIRHAGHHPRLRQIHRRRQRRIPRR